MPKPKFAQSFDDMPTEGLGCRSFLNHRWEVARTIVEKEGRRKVYHVHTQCVCGTRKTFFIAATTGLRTRAPVYSYPDDYLVTDIRAWGGKSTLKANAAITFLQRIAA